MESRRIYPIADREAGSQHVARGSLKSTYQVCGISLLKYHSKMFQDNP